MAVGGGSVPVVLPRVATAAGNAPGARQGRGEPWRLGAGVWLCLGWAPGRGGGGIPSCALGGRHCGWERPFRTPLCPQGSTSSGCSGGLWTTGALLQVRALGLCGAGNHVFRPLLALSRSSPTWRSQKGLAVGSRPLLLHPFAEKSQSPTVFPSSLVSAGNPRDRTLNSGRLAQPCFWHFVGQRALEHLLG